MHKYVIGVRLATHHINEDEPENELNQLSIVACTPRLEWEMAPWRNQ